jgi:hypothetical protein
VRKVLVLQRGRLTDLGPRVTALGDGLQDAHVQRDVHPAHLQVEL